jgi:hypothetical protein
MTTLNISGRRVKVDDSFKSLSPEQQNATVEEIIQSMGDSAPSGPAQPQDTQGGSTLGGAAQTFAENSISGIPIVGPALQTGADYVGTEIMGRLSGQDPAEMRQGIWDRREQRADQNPASALSGSLTGGIAGLGAVGATAAGARALGVVGGNLGTRMAAAGASNAAIAGADTVARGGESSDVLNNMVVGGTIGAAIPAVGAGVRAGIGAVADRVMPSVNAVRAPAQEANRRLGSALQRDITANPQAIVSGADEVAARQAGVPLLNADRGGETTRALARSVANQSPEARAVIERTASDRFGGQGQRASEFIRRVTGGSVDDLAYQDSIRNAARQANRPAYNRAYSSPRAQEMWNEGYEQLMQAPAMQRAAQQATGRGANRAAVEGFQPVRNPFDMVDGRVTLRQNADGSIARPTLQFWDQVKRNMDSMISRAERGGDMTYAGDLKALRGQLLQLTDNAVPEYAAARRGAAAFFDAEDALDAGRSFANRPRTIPEAKRAFQSFSPAERSAFATGYASEVIDRIKAAGDRTNVINSVFKSQASRESMEMVFGPQRMKEIEAYVRVEDLADRLRGAMGNSTTARQLVELGIGGGAGFAVTGGDWTGALAGAAVARGARNLGQRVDNRVMQRVAEMLVSDDPAMIQRAIKEATKSNAFMGALEDLGTALAAPARGTALEQTRQLQ